jgi:sugar-specific transcriptional regulator TrmB
MADNIVSQAIDQVKDKVSETDKVTLTVLSSVATYVFAQSEREKKAALAGLATYFLADPIKELLANVEDSKNGNK